MTEATTVPRVVDAHVHHWDPSRVDWYPYLASDDALAGLGMKDVTRMRRLFDQDIYLAESARWNVEKYVHVAAAVGPHILTETRELGELTARTGHPDAIIGGLDPGVGAAAALAQLDSQVMSPRFRGIRVSEGMDSASPVGRAILGALQERGLVYDLVVHPDEMADTARALEAFDTLTIVVEHTGWPLSEDAEHVERWRDGMARLAALGEHVHCKLSGLAMTLNRFDTAAFRPWIEHCLEVFGDTRCFFASNFPVDGLFGDFDDLYNVYDEVTAGLDAAARARLFADNAERVYGITGVS
ncbi:MAG TPA: amidohydrolase family protein [Amycolatopsis sp.]|nr:amidohydrolase family protein [Amycolatopsis sp.]